MTDHPTITSPAGNTYELVKELPEGEVYRIYISLMHQKDQGPRTVLVKVASGVDLNDFAKCEAGTLKHINSQIRHMSFGNKLLVPELLDSFVEQDRIVNVTDFAQGYFTLEQIRERYPHGIPPEHAAWMFNRILNAMMLAHSCGVIHGAILPCHVLIYSGIKTDDLRHTGVLVDWTNAVQEQQQTVWPHLPSISGIEEHEAFYPREVFLREPATPQTDLAMAAACAIYLLGGDVKTNTLPDSTPWNFAQILKACRKENSSERPRDISNFYDQLQRIYRAAFGPPTFYELPIH